MVWGFRLVWRVLFGWLLFILEAIHLNLECVDHMMSGIESATFSLLTVAINELEDLFGFFARHVQQDDLAVAH